MDDSGALFSCRIHAGNQIYGGRRAGQVIALNRKYENRRFSNVREGCFDGRGRKIKEMQYLKT